MCETKISNLWTTSAVLSKLTSLVELRFQKCLCCNYTGQCLSSSNQTTNLQALWNHSSKYYYKEAETPSIDSRDDATFQASNTKVNPILNNEVELSSRVQSIGLSELSNVLPYLVRHEGLQDEVTKLFYYKIDVLEIDEAVLIFLVDSIVWKKVCLTNFSLQIIDSRKG